MKKEYLTPDLWVFDFKAACMDPASNPGVTSDDFSAPARRNALPDGPAGL